MSVSSASVSKENEENQKMTRHKDIYDKDLKATPEWQYLYFKWQSIRKLPHSKRFDRFLDFYRWAMACGFVISAKLCLLDESKPYSPDNCLWVLPAGGQPLFSAEQKRSIEKWNKTVGRIRAYYGMEPLEQKGES